ncbi:hypothetical protein NL676_036120 [Syzygium grande]|nr:hypothetical protein NL676_036120 [Syzygium grande]
MSIGEDAASVLFSLKLSLNRAKAVAPKMMFRVFDVFDEKKNGVIEFEEFVHGLSVFHPNAPVEDKIDCKDSIYGLLILSQQSSFVLMVKQMVIALLMESDTSLSEDLLEAIIDMTFADADADMDGRISKDEWKAFALRNPALLRNMTLPYLKEVTTVFPSFVFKTEVED